jgi:plastocyanin
MKRLIVLLTVCLTALVVSPLAANVLAAGPDQRSHPVAGLQAKVRTISGTVGPGFTISMSKARTHVGMYTVTIHDKSSFHNFHLTGPGSVNRKTGVSFVGTVTWQVRLRAGTYKFQCDVHPDMMHGKLTTFAS